MQVNFENIMILIAHLGNRDEKEEQEIIRKSEGDSLLRGLWEYRQYRLSLWMKFNRNKYPLFGTKPGFLHLLKEELSPDQNWAMIWQDEKVSDWMKKTRKVWDIECAFKERFSPDEVSNDWAFARSIVELNKS